MTQQEMLNAFIRNIETLMKEKNLSKADLAAKIGVNQLEIEDLYSGADFEKLHVLITISDKNNIDIEQFVALNKKEFTDIITTLLTAVSEEFYSEIDFKKYQTILKIADYFCVSVDWIISLTDERNIPISAVPVHIRIENPTYHKNAVKLVKKSKNGYDELLSLLKNDLEYCKNNNFDNKYSERIEQEIQKLNS